jgi:hypothetical protein
MDRKEGVGDGERWMDLGICKMQNVTGMRMEWGYRNLAWLPRPAAARVFLGALTVQYVCLYDSPSSFAAAAIAANPWV